MTVSYRNIAYPQGAGTSFHHVVLAICLVYLVIVGTDLLSIVLWGNNLANKIEILTLLPILATTTLYYRHLLRGTFASPEIALLIIWTTASVTWSDYPALSMERAVPLIVTTAFGIALGSMMSLRWLLLFIAVFFAVSMFLCLGAIATLPQARGIPPWGDTWNGIYMHKNELGSNAVMAILTACFGARQTTGRLKTLFQITIAIGLVMLLACESRTAQVIGVIVLSGYFSSLLFPRQEVIWAIAFILMSAFVVGLVAFVLASAVAEPIFALIGRKPTLSDRIPIWQLAWPHVMDKFWTGYGYIAYWYEEATHLRVYSSIAKLGFVPHYSHNGLIELWLNAGFVGVVLFIGALLRFFSSVFYSMRKVRNRDELAFAFVLGMTFLFLNITESNILGRLDAMWIFLIAYSTRTNLVAKALRSGVGARHVAMRQMSGQAGFQNVR